MTDSSDFLLAESIVAAVERVMHQHHFDTTPKIVAELEKVLSCSRGTAYRRMRGDNWSLAEIEQIQVRFGCHLRIFGETNADPEHESVAARWKLGGKTLQCRVWIGLRVPNSSVRPHLLTKNNGEWTVIDTSDAQLGGEYFQINKLIVNFFDRVPRVAVLDDEKDVADSIGEFLASNGFEVEPFYSGAALKTALEKTKFDCFVLDLMLGKGTSEDIIKKIREDLRLRAPIVLLTGQVLAGNVSGMEVTRLKGKYGLEIREKPASAHFIRVDLAEGLGIA